MQVKWGKVWHNEQKEWFLFLDISCITQNIIHFYYYQVKRK